MNSQLSLKYEHICVVQDLFLIKSEVLLTVGADFIKRWFCPKYLLLFKHQLLVHHKTQFAFYSPSDLQVEPSLHSLRPPGDKWHDAAVPVHSSPHHQLRPLQTQHIHLYSHANYQHHNHPKHPAKFGLHGSRALHRNLHPPPSWTDLYRQKNLRPDQSDLGHECVLHHARFFFHPGHRATAVFPL